MSRKLIASIITLHIFLCLISLFYYNEVYYEGRAYFDTIWDKIFAYYGIYGFVFPLTALGVLSMIFVLWISIYGLFGGWED